MLLSFDAGLNIRTIATRHGRSVTAIQHRMYRRSIKPMLQMRRADGMSVADVCAELGVPRRTVSHWIKVGWLAARAVRVVRMRVYTIAPDAVVRLVQAYPLLDYRPNADWTPIVEAARNAWHTRYISRDDLSILLCLGVKRVERLKIAPSCGRGQGTQRVYYDRAIVRAWLDARRQGYAIALYANTERGRCRATPCVVRIVAVWCNGCTRFVRYSDRQPRQLPAPGGRSEGGPPGTNQEGTMNQDQELYYQTSITGMETDITRLTQRLDAALAALRTIRDSYGQVCSDFETCDHAACRASYSAWHVADQALKEIER